MDKIEALISDSDGTLLDTVSLIRQGQYETVRQYLTEYGIPSEEMPTFSTFSKALDTPYKDTPYTVLIFTSLQCQLIFQQFQLSLTPLIRAKKLAILSR